MLSIKKIELRFYMWLPVELIPKNIEEREMIEDIKIEANPYW